MAEADCICFHLAFQQLHDSFFELLRGRSLILYLCTTNEGSLSGYERWPARGSDAVCSPERGSDSTLGWWPSLQATSQLPRPSFFPLFSPGSLQGRPGLRGAVGWTETRKSLQVPPDDNHPEQQLRRNRFDIQASTHSDNCASSICIRETAA
eukprot:3941432-Rhodomonas_salina.1